MKTEQQIRAKLAELEQQLAKGETTSYGSRQKRGKTNSVREKIIMLQWVLDNGSVL